MNKLIPALVCMVLIGTGIAVLADTATDSGNGTIVLNLSAPKLRSVSWFVPGEGYNGTIEPNTEFFVLVNVSDQDTLDDIRSVSFELYETTLGLDDLQHNYKFRYNETTSNDDAIAGTFSKILPSAGAYLVTGVEPIGAHDSQAVQTYNFTVKVDNLAHKANWRLSASVKDSTLATATKSTGAIVPILAYMTLNANTLNMGLSYTQATVSDTFTTDVTSNAGYILEARATGNFTWTDDATYTWAPTFFIKMSTDPIGGKTLTGTYQTWYTVSNGVYQNHVLTHLVTVGGMPTNQPGGTYTGPTIEMQVTNP